MQRFIFLDENLYFSVPITITKLSAPAEKMGDENEAQARQTPPLDHRYITHLWAWYLLGAVPGQVSDSHFSTSPTTRKGFKIRVLKR